MDNQGSSKAGEIRVGAVMFAGGEQVRVIAVDSDPSCSVWVVSVANPDADRFVPREALSIR